MPEKGVAASVSESGSRVDPKSVGSVKLDPERNPYLYGQAKIRALK